MLQTDDHLRVVLLLLSVELSVSVYISDMLIHQSKMTQIINMYTVHLDEDVIQYNDGDVKGRRCKGLRTVYLELRWRGGLS